jgi:hypothetical protein
MNYLLDVPKLAGTYMAEANFHQIQLDIYAQAYIEVQVSYPF